MTFAEFMELALYHPKTGYYTNRSRIGKGGDFATGPTTSPLLGEIMAEAIVELSGSMMPSGIIEFGGAQGYLAEDIFRQLQWHLPYCIVEKTRERKKSDSPNIKYYPSLAKVPKKILKNPVIIGNEFLDALPFHIVEQTKKGLREVFVMQNGERYQEALGTPSNKRIESYFHLLQASPREGNRAEVSLTSLDWLKGIRRACKHSVIILIDYGRPSYELFDVHRPHGTLRCFNQHQLDDNPYEKVGEKDITADVNWTAIEKEGEKLGFQKVLLWPQSKFLLKYGERLLHERAFMDKEKRGLQALIHPEYMGNAFQVMVLKTFSE